MPAIETDTTPGGSAVYGCITGLALMAIVAITMSFVFTRLLGWLDADSEKNGLLVMWLAAVGSAAYVASRRHRIGTWSASLWVGGLAFAFLAAQLPTPD